MAILCIVGRHGAGKSTLGTEMSSASIKHLSVGLLRRLAMTGQYPSDIPASLINAMRRAPAGGHLPMETAVKLVRFAETFANCVLDGFPSSIEHMNLLPVDAKLAYVWSPARIREERLTYRATTSLRQWTAGRPSAREHELANLLKAARRERNVMFVTNRLGPIKEIAELLKKNCFPLA